jgi:hypothetical protein
MAKQRITITRTTRTRNNGATVTQSSPAGKTKIGGSGGKSKGKSRCPSCGKFR